MSDVVLNSTGLGEFIQGNKFAVPPYQRAYAWRTKNVSDLLKDIRGAMDRPTKNKEQQRPFDYFLGSIVVIDRDGTDRLELVDGQQRLATVSIIITAIRDWHIQDGDSAAADEYERTYLRWYDVPTGARPPRMRLNEDDNECYELRILARPKDRNHDKKKWKIPSHKRLWEAYQTASKYIQDNFVKGLSTQDAVLQLDRFVKYLTHQTKVIEVSVPNDAEAFVIFETLNDRGLELSIADLLKNFLFGLAGERLDEARAKWASMDGILKTLGKSKDRTVDYIRQLWGSMHGLIRGRELFWSIKEKTVNATKAVALAAQLADEANVYAATVNTNHELWDEYDDTTRAALEALRIMGMERVRILILSIVAAFSRNEAQKAIKYLEAAGVRLLVAGGPAGTVEDEFANTAKAIRDKKISKAKELAASLRTVPNDSTFQTAFATYRSGKPKLARYLLRCLEIANRPGGDVDSVPAHDRKKVNLEHVIPDSESERIANWPGLTKEKGADLARRLGNMLLLPAGINSRLGGKPWAAKKAAYQSCQAWALPQMLAAAYEDWGEPEVNDWQNKLAAMATKLWSIQIAK